MLTTHRFICVLVLTIVATVLLSVGWAYAHKTITGDFVSHGTFVTMTLALQDPATAPARTPWKHTVPQGFVVVESRGRKVICELQDSAVMKDALDKMPDLVRPTTNPAALLTNIRDRRERVGFRMMSDLGLNNAREFDKVLDDELLPRLQKIEELRPNVLYIVTTYAKLVELVRGGWGAPKFYFNRAANDIAVDTNLGLSIDHEMDDVVIPLLYLPDSDAATKRKVVTDSIRANESGLHTTIAGQAQVMIQVGLARAVNDAAFQALELSPDQEWFSIGVINVLSARYLCMFNDMNERDLVAAMSLDMPGALRAAGIDLLKPTPRDQIRPNALEVYVDALRRKSTLVVQEWLKNAPEGSLPRVMASVRQSKPADGAALVRVLKDVSGIDVTEMLKPR
jgi:hypothetical protein